jgi:hypothetical protein
VRCPPCPPACSAHCPCLPWSLPASGPWAVLRTPPRPVLQVCTADACTRARPQAQAPCAAPPGRRAAGAGHTGAGPAATHCLPPPWGSVSRPPVLPLAALHSLIPAPCWVQSGEHSPVDDARAALYLYLHHRKVPPAAARVRQAGSSTPLHRPAASPASLQEGQLACRGGTGPTAWPHLTAGVGGAHQEWQRGAQQAGAACGTPGGSGGSRGGCGCPAHIPRSAAGAGGCAGRSGRSADRA